MVLCKGEEDGDERKKRKKRGAKEWRERVKREALSIVLGRTRRVPKKLLFLEGCSLFFFGRRHQEERLLLSFIFPLFFSLAGKDQEKEVNEMDFLPSQVS